MSVALAGQQLSGCLFIQLRNDVIAGFILCHANYMLRVLKLLGVITCTVGVLSLSMDVYIVCIVCFIHKVLQSHTDNELREEESIG